MLKNKILFVHLNRGSTLKKLPVAWKMVKLSELYQVVYRVYHQYEVLIFQLLSKTFLMLNILNCVEMIITLFLPLITMHSWDVSINFTKWYHFKFHVYLCKISSFA